MFSLRQETQKEGNRNDSDVVTAGFAVQSFAFATKIAQPQKQLKSELLGFEK